MEPPGPVEPPMRPSLPVIRLRMLLRCRQNRISVMTAWARTNDRLRPEPPDDHRGQPHGDQGGQRGDADHLGHEEPKGGDAEPDGPPESDLDPEGRGDPLAALEAEEDRVEVAQEGRQPGRRQAVGAQAEQVPGEHGQHTLEAVAHQGDGRGLLAPDAQDIGRPRVVRPLGPRVGQAHQTADDDGAGDGPQQVGGEDEQDGRGHGRH